MSVISVKSVLPNVGGKNNTTQMVVGFVLLGIALYGGYKYVYKPYMDKQNTKKPV